MLIDSFSRSFEYLRLSITDACNFKCVYCLPNGFKANLNEKYLDVNEIRRLVTAFAELGLWKIRLTGGEPTLRRDFEKIVHTISEVNGIKKIALSTNGFRLNKEAKNFNNLGITNINISIDSLDPNEFYAITKYDNLKDILNGIDKCLELNYEHIKINSVILKNMNKNSLELFLNYIKDKNVSVRFIELMRTNDNVSLFNYEHIRAEHIIQHILQLGFTLQSKEIASGPALVYKNTNFKGSIGIIAPYSPAFCQSCNRLRINSIGKLRLCLFGEGAFSLRRYLQADEQKNELKTVIIDNLKEKKFAHHLNENNSGDTPHLASIGG